MKASEMIRALEQLKDKWGDIDVEVYMHPCTYSTPVLTVTKITPDKNVIAIR